MSSTRWAVIVIAAVAVLVGVWLETISGQRWTIRYGSGTRRDPVPLAPWLR